MVQVIRTATPRQRALSDVLSEKIGQAAQLGVGAFQEAKQTARQRALEDRRMAMQDAAIQREEQRYADQQRRLDEQRRLRMAQAGAVGDTFEEQLRSLEDITGKKTRQAERIAQMEEEKALFEAGERLKPIEETRAYKMAQAKVGASPIKQNQWTAAGYAKRAELAEKELKPFESVGSEMAYSITSKIPDAVKSEEIKGFEQAKRNFISAVLRKESGAAISPEEFLTEDKKYFPQPSDTPRLLKQKERARQQAFLNLKAEAGRAFDLIPSVDVEDRSASNDGAMQMLDALYTGLGGK